MPASPSNHRQNNARQGVTLIELLGVVSIIAILLGIVLSTINTVQRFSRKTVAQTEVRAIADAWMRYFDHYNGWPTNSDSKTGYLSDSKMTSVNVYHTYRISETLANALEGRITDDKEAEELNPDGIHFIEFTRYSQDSEPTNPWHRRGTVLGELADDGKINDGAARFFYYVRFDINANGLTSTEGIPGLTKEERGPEGYASRSVLVWTYNPDDANPDGADAKNVISSWSH